MPTPEHLPRHGKPSRKIIQAHAPGNKTKNDGVRKTRRIEFSTVHVKHILYGCGEAVAYHSLSARTAECYILVRRSTLPNSVKPSTAHVLGTTTGGPHSPLVFVSSAVPESGLRSEIGKGLYARDDGVVLNDSIWHGFALEHARQEGISWGCRVRWFRQNCRMPSHLTLFGLAGFSKTSVALLVRSSSTSCILDNLSSDR